MANETARTLAHCRKQGWLPWKVEQTIPKTFIKRDMYGFLDVVVLDDKPGILGLQVTSHSTRNMGTRVRKIKTECRVAAQRWLDAGLRIAVWGWHQPKGKGTRWKVRIVEVTEL